MRVLYLGERFTDSYIADCLRISGEFERVDHLVKPTLEFGHISMNPQPDVIVLKCDWEDQELGWSDRYAKDIPKIFIACDHCTYKIEEYAKRGQAFMIEPLLRKAEDLYLRTVVDTIIKAVDK